MDEKDKIIEEQKKIIDALKKQNELYDKTLQEATQRIRNMNLENKELRNLASQFENITEE